MNQPLFFEGPARSGRGGCGTRRTAPARRCGSGRRRRAPRRRRRAARRHRRSRRTSRHAVGRDHRPRAGWASSSRSRRAPPPPSRIVLNRPPVHAVAQSRRSCVGTSERCRSRRWPREPAGSSRSPITGVGAGHQRPDQHAEAGDVAGRQTAQPALAGPGADPAQAGPGRVPQRGRRSARPPWAPRSSRTWRSRPPCRRVGRPGPGSRPEAAWSATYGAVCAFPGRS